MEEAEFWERLEKMFDRIIPIDPHVRYAINEAIKESRNQEPEKREEVINAALYLAYDIVSVAFHGKDAEGASYAETAAEFIAEKLEENKKTEPSAQETKTETEAKEMWDGKISPGDFLERFQGIEKLKRKGGPEEKPKEKEKFYPIFNEKVTNTYLDIIKEFVEKNKEKIFNGNDYQTLKENKVHLLHFQSGLPTFQGSTHRLWNGVIHYLENEIERFKVPLQDGETHSNECDQVFSKAAKDLLDKAVESMFYAFEKFQSSIKAGETGVSKKDVKEEIRNKLLKDTKIKLGKDIEEIIYPDIEERPYGVFVKRRALKLWKEQGGSMKEFFDFTEKVREMLHKLPEFVVRWGEWAHRAFEKLNSPEAAS